MKSYSISQRNKSRGGKNWYGREFEGGILVREFSLKTKNKQNALDWLNMMNASRFMPEDVKARLEPKDRPIKDAVESFLIATATTAGTDSKTEKAYKYRLGNLVRWCEQEGILMLRELSSEKALHFSQQMGEKFAPKTMRELLRCIRQFFGWCCDTYGMVDFDPLKTIKPPKLVKRAKDFWTPREINKILDCAPTPEYRLFWAFMAFAGCRYSEPFKFGPESITDDGRLRIVGKGNKEAFLPISKRLKNEINKCPLTDGIFNRSMFKKADYANGKLREAVQKAGLKAENASHHKWRHSFISNLVRAGVNIRAVADLARHSDVKITLETYSHLLPSDLKKAVDAKVKV